MKLTLVAVHTEVCGVFIATAGTTVGMIVMKTLLLVTVGTEAQVEFDVITHQTESLFAKVELLYVLVVLLCNTPSLYH